MTRRRLTLALMALAVVALFHVAWLILDVQLVYIILQGFVATGATLFCAVYAATAPWWESRMGRNIMLLGASIALILDLGFVFNLLGRPEWMREVFAFLYLAIGVAFWHRLTILVDVQHHPTEFPEAGTPRNR